jgi:3,4-dihydroxy 2-butanone 4-phosphate synthase/GTP cyclohydrolase II
VGDENLTEHELRHADGDFRVVVLGRGSDVHGNQPCAAVFGEPEDGCLVRIHSRCVYGEIFESVDCDCRDQLRQSMAMMRKAGSGVLIYLDQEGRGAGLLAKALGYQLTQREGLDTFSSYRVLGLPEDSRSYEDAVAILRGLGLRRVRLLTNNPAKVAALATADFQVEQQPFLVRGQSAEARRYLAAKAKFGHTISLAELEADAARDRWRWLHKLLRRTRRRPQTATPERAPARVVELPVPTVNPVEKPVVSAQPTDLVS